MSGHLCCVCGAVSIQFHDPAPKLRGECGCCDCRQALQWAQLQGGPTAPVLPDAWYFANDFTFISGKENIKLYKLRENGSSIRFVSTCCSSTLLVHHPGYQNNIVMVLAQGAKLAVQPIGAFARFQMKDFPKERIGELAPFKGNPVDKDNLDDFGSYASVEEAFGNIVQIWTEKVDNPTGTNTQEIINFQTVEVLELPHYKELL